MAKQIYEKHANGSVDNNNYTDILRLALKCQIPYNIILELTGPNLIQKLLPHLTTSENLIADLAKLEETFILFKFLLLKYLASFILSKSQFNIFTTSISLPSKSSSYPFKFIPNTIYYYVRRLIV